MVAQVNSILEVMLTAKGLALADEGDLLLSRLVTIFMPNFIPPSPPSSSKSTANDMAGLEGETALEALKTKLRWRDDVRPCTVHRVNTRARAPAHSRARAPARPRPCRHSPAPRT